MKMCLIITELDVRPIAEANINMQEIARHGILSLRTRPFKVRRMPSLVWGYIHAVFCVYSEHLPGVQKSMRCFCNFTSIRLTLPTAKTGQSTRVKRKYTDPVVRRNVSWLSEQTFL